MNVHALRLNVRMLRWHGIRYICVFFFLGDVEHRACGCTVPETYYFRFCIWWMRVDFPSSLNLLVFILVSICSHKSTKLHHTYDQMKNASEAPVLCASHPSRNCTASPIHWKLGTRHKQSTAVFIISNNNNSHSYVSCMLGSTFLKS